MKKILVYISVFLNLIVILGLLAILILKGPSWYYQKIVSVFSGNQNNNKVLTMNDNNYYTKASIYEQLDGAEQKGKIVFLGDSITRNGEWDELFNDQDIINRGINGDTSAGILKRIDSITILKPQKIFIMMGINDFSKSKSIDSVMENYKKVIKKIQNDSPDTKIYIQSVLPINIKDSLVKPTTIIDFNNQLKSFSIQEGINYIDLYSSFVDADQHLIKKYTFDGVHVNGDGYELWKSKIVNYITH